MAASSSLALLVRYGGGWGIGCEWPGFAHVIMINYTVDK